MKKIIISLLLVFMLICSIIPTAHAASTATMIRAVDNNTNLGKKTFNVTVTFKTSTTAASGISGSACDNSSLKILFPAGIQKTSVSKSGASTSWEGDDGRYYYYMVNLGKNFMTTSGDTLTITFTGVTSLPYSAELTLASTTITRTYKGSLTITQNGSTYHTATLGGNTGAKYTTNCKDTYPSPTSSAINLSASSVTAPLNSTSNITYTVYSNSPRGGDLADGYLLRTSEANNWNCKGYVISERLVQASNTNAFSANGITLDSANKKISINGATINSAQQTYQFRIESTLVSGVLSGSTVSYLGNQVKVYSPVITVSPQPASVTFRYHPNGGSLSDNYVTWTAKPSDNFPDSHWNYTNGTYAMTRHGYTATGYYAKADGSCSVHEEYNFTSYADLCSKYGVSTTGTHTIDIYAQWSPNNYTVNFNSNGGAAVSSITAPYESSVTLPTPTKAGHTFNGWQGDLKQIVTLTNGMEINDTSKGTIGSNSGYAVTEYLVPVIGGMTYTSNYEVCGLYSFDANGNFIKRESSYATTHTVSPNAAFVRVEVNVTKGISFEEYQNNLTLTYTVPGGTSFPVGGNQTLTAQWSANTYTITFDAQGGTTSLTTLPVIYGSNQNNKINTSTNPTKTDYIFDGWYTAPEGGTQIYKVSNGSCFQSDYWSKEYDVAGNGAVWQHAGNVTLYAHWIYAGTSIITFDAQGGTTSLTTLTATYGSNTNNRLDTTTNPTREGYIFEGWFDAPTGGTQIYKVSNGSCIASNYWTKSWEVAGTGATWKGPKELTLYAQWTIKTYTVIWKNYDGSVLETDTGVAYNSMPTYNGSTPTKAEDESFTYTFDSWSPDLSAVVGNVEYVATYTSASKRVDPTYTVTIPATAQVNDSFTVSAAGVVLNTDQTLTVTLQSDFTLRSAENASLSFVIDNGDVVNNTIVLSINGNGDTTQPISDSKTYAISLAESVRFAGRYTGNVTFTIAIESD